MAVHAPKVLQGICFRGRSAESTNGHLVAVKNIDLDIDDEYGRQNCLSSMPMQLAEMVPHLQDDFTSNHAFVDAFADSINDTSEV